MKIGILTFHDADNYGAVLQAYALKMAISKYEECQIINYYNAYFHGEDKRSVKQNIKELFYAKAFQKKKDGFQKFREEYLTGNIPWVTKDKLFELNEMYDLFVVGSDQVWNLSCSGESDSYFLPFVKSDNKKVSFAASFGSFAPKLDKKYIDYIRKFSFVSVREKSGKDFLNKNGIMSIKLLDPIFLLQKEKWNELTQKSKQRYILVYEVVNGKDMLEFAKKLSVKTRLPIHFITASRKPQLKVKAIRDADPLEWLSQIRNAEYVITNSFHGLAFSLIFNRQFYVELLSNSTTNARILELLETIGEKKRIITEAENAEIDFTKINDLIAEERTRSMSYIRSFVRH